MSYGYKNWVVALKSANTMAKEANSASVPDAIEYAQHVVEQFQNYVADTKASKLEALFAVDQQQLDPGMQIEPSVPVLKLKKTMAKPASIEEMQPIPFMNWRGEERLVWYPRKNQVPEGGGYEEDPAILNPIQHFNIQDLLARFFIEVHAHWGVVHNWRNNIIGTTSLYTDTRHEPHMPMFDYDGKNVKTQIRKDVKLLQENYNLGDAWVYETRRGFHVYFFTDSVSSDNFFGMLEKVNCCKGYKNASLRRGYAVLRVSAKYTTFDIAPLYVLVAPGGKLQRMTRKAHTIRALIDLGTQCGTHFASMFPQWAHFTQDPREWKQTIKIKKPTAKRIRKAKMDDLPGAIPPGYIAENQIKFVPIEQSQGSITYTYDTSTSNNTVFSTGLNVEPDACPAWFYQPGPVNGTGGTNGNSGS